MGQNRNVREVGMTHLGLHQYHIWNDGRKLRNNQELEHIN